MNEPKRISIPAVLCYSAMLTAILYLLAFQTTSDSPLRNGGKMPGPQRLKLNWLAESDAVISNAAAGQNVVLHVDPTPKDFQKDPGALCIQYYGAVYRLYPNRVYVGNDSRVINDAEGFYKADEKPSLPWMKEHHVTGVVTLSLPQDSSNRNARP